MVFRKFVNKRNENERNELFMEKPVSLGSSILEISKSPMYVFWLYNTKLKYGAKVQLCYMNTDSFIIHIKDEVFT